MSQTFKFGNKQWYGKKGSVLAYNDENNNFKPLPFDFTRSSSATRVNKDGLIEVVGSDEPRVDYLNNADGHLLLEPSRSNGINYSEDFSNYSKSTGITLTSDYGISPDGTQNSTRMQVPDSSNYYIVTNGVSATAGTYVISVYIKGTSGEKVQLYSDGSAGGSGFTECTLTGDWHRFERVVTTTATGVINPHILFGYGITPNAQDIEVWGWQCEAGSYATSYIPTSGSSVTRAAEASNANIPTSAAGQSEGTLYFEMDFMNDANEYPAVFLWNGTSTNRIVLQRRGNNKYAQVLIDKSGQSTISLSGTSAISDGVHKMAFAYSSSRLVGYVDGVKFAEQLGSFVTYTNELNRVDLIPNTSQAGIKDVKLYNEALTDAQLIALTS